MAERLDLFDILEEGRFGPFLLGRPMWEISYLADPPDVWGLALEEGTDPSMRFGNAYVAVEDIGDELRVSEISIAVTGEQTPFYKDRSGERAFVVVPEEILKSFDLLVSLIRARGVGIREMEAGSHIVLTDGVRIRFDRGAMARVEQ